MSGESFARPSSLKLERSASDALLSDAGRTSESDAPPSVAAPSGHQRRLSVDLLTRPGSGITLVSAATNVTTDPPIADNVSIGSARRSSSTTNAAPPLDTGSGVVPAAATATAAAEQPPDLPVRASLDSAVLRKRTGLVRGGSTESANLLRSNLDGGGAEMIAAATAGGAQHPAAVMAKSKSSTVTFNVPKPSNVDREADDVRFFSSVRGFLRENVDAGVRQRRASVTGDITRPVRYSEKLGMWTGVYVPCLQQILGIVYIVRLPRIVGYAGIGLALTVVLLSTASTVLTTLSVAAIVTNGPVPAGGIYFIISRALGPEFGGAIGFIYVLGQTLTVSLIVLGAAETLILAAGFDTSGLGAWALTFWGSVILLVMTLLIVGNQVWLARNATALLSLVLIGFLSLLIGFFAAPYPDRPAPGVTGLSWNNFAANFWPKLDGDFDFRTVLFLFYPSVTGMLAGANRSGALKNPGRVIPLGTLYAIATTSGVYVLLVLLYGAVASPDALQRPPDTFLLVSYIGWPVAVIVQAAAVMSAMGAATQALISAPRILKAIALDDTMPFLRPLARRSRVLVSSIFLLYFVAAIGVLVGNIDAIAPYVTMFILLAYGGVNLACFALTVFGVGNFRPIWRTYSWHTALAGFLLPMLFMFVISWFWAVAAFAVVAALYRYIYVHKVRAFYGQGTLGFKYEAARRGLLELEAVDPQYHARNWRPQILAIVKVDRGSGYPTTPSFVHILNNLSQGNGLLIIGSALHGRRSGREAMNNMYRDLVARVRLGLAEFMDTERMPGLSAVISTPDLKEGYSFLIQEGGLGRMRPNLVAINWPDDWERESQADLFVFALNEAQLWRKSVLVVKGANNFPTRFHPPHHTTIDVWWLLHDGGLLLLVPHLLRKHRVWRDCYLRVFTIALPSDNITLMKAELERVLYLARIEADVHVIAAKSLLDLYGYVRQTSDRTAERARAIAEIAAWGSKEPCEVLRTRRASASSSDDDDTASLGSADSGGDYRDAEADMRSDLRSSVRSQSSGRLRRRKRHTHSSIGGRSIGGRSTDTSASKGSSSFGRLGARLGRSTSVGHRRQPSSQSGKSVGSVATDAGAAAAAAALAAGERPTCGLADADVASMDDDSLRHLLLRHSAIQLNHRILRQSRRAALVLINLPLPLPDAPGHSHAKPYAQFVHHLTHGLRRVMLIRGSGDEIIRITG